MDHTRKDAKSEYPKRGNHFAHRFTRLLTKTAAAQELGPEGAWLLTIIAHQEDAKRYSGPVTFYNTQLMPLCGIGSDRRLCQVRERLEEAGWLHYEPGAKRRPGRYCVLIPPDLAETSDTPIDEAAESFSCESQEKAKSIRSESEEKAPLKRRESARPSTLSLSLSQNPEEEYPSLGDVIPELMEKFNKVPGVTKCSVFSGKRKKCLVTRLRDPTFRDRWPEAINRLAESGFCQGENDRGWRADMDWFLKPDSVLRLLEGKYARASPESLTEGSTENRFEKGNSNDRHQRNSTEWRDREFQKALHGD